jgi:hypothetical protein
VVLAHSQTCPGPCSLTERSGLYLSWRPSTGSGSSAVAPFATPEEEQSLWRH